MGSRTGTRLPGQCSPQSLVGSRTPLPAQHHLGFCFVVLCAVSYSVISDSATHGLDCQASLSMDFPGKNTGVASYSLLQVSFLTQESNLGFPHCWQILYHLSHQGGLCLCHVSGLECPSCLFPLSPPFWTQPITTSSKRLLRSFNLLHSCPDLQAPPMQTLPLMHLLSHLLGTDQKWH